MAHRAFHHRIKLRCRNRGRKPDQAAPPPPRLNLLRKKRQVGGLIDNRLGKMGGKPHVGIRLRALPPGAGQIFGVRTLVLVGVIPEVVKKRGGGGGAP